MKTLEKLIIKWAGERGIYENSSPQAQTLKAMSELGELADAILKQDHDGIVDGLGDTIVCLVSVAHMCGFDLEHAMQTAYDEIKDRKGYMSKNGAFVRN